MKFPSPADLPEQKGLVDPFLRPDGTRVESAEDWHIQRCESIKLLQHYIYGQTPDLPDHLGVTIEKDEEVFGGKASRQLLTLSCEHKGCHADLRVGLIVPSKGGPFPVVIKNDAYRFDRQEVSDAKRRKQYADAPRDDVEMGVFEEAVSRGYAICKFIRTDWADDTPESRDRGHLPALP
jgi:hypothetical protein